MLQKMADFRVFSCFVHFLVNKIDVNINTGAQSINTERESLRPGTVSTSNEKSRKK